MLFVVNGRRKRKTVAFLFCHEGHNRFLFQSFSEKFPKPIGWCLCAALRPRVALSPGGAVNEVESTHHVSFILIVRSRRLFGCDD